MHVRSPIGGGTLVDKRPLSLSVTALALFALIPGLGWLAPAMRGSGSARRASESDAPVPQHASRDSVLDRPQEALALIEQYLGQPLDSLRQNRPAVRALIVTLPDPQDSPLDWGYDAGIASIRRAYEAAGFGIDRFWLPWSASPRRGDPPVGSPFRQSNPGILLFRSLGAERQQPNLEVVFVVGESPTAGVHRGAFASTLKQIGAL